MTLSSALPDYRLRPVTPPDRPFLVRLYGSTRQDELANTDWTAEQKAEFVGHQFELRDRYYRAHYPGATLEVIEVDGRPVGRVYVHRRRSEIRLMDIAIIPESRGRGLGTAILQRLQAEAQRTTRPLTVHVEKFNSALELYRRLGFEAIEDRGVYLLLEWRPESG